MEESTVTEPVSSETDFQKYLSKVAEEIHKALNPGAEIGKHQVGFALFVYPMKGTTKAASLVTNAPHLVYENLRPYMNKMSLAINRKLRRKV